MFHLLNFACAGARAGVFPFRRTIDDHVRPAILVDILMDLPGLLFFTTYTLLVLFWAEIYHQARSLPTDSLRPTFVVANVFTYLFQASLWTWAGLEARDREDAPTRLESLPLRRVVRRGEWFRGVRRTTLRHAPPLPRGVQGPPQKTARGGHRHSRLRGVFSRAFGDGGALDLYVRGSTRRALAPRGETRRITSGARSRRPRWCSSSFGNFRRGSGIRFAGDGGRGRDGDARSEGYRRVPDEPQ